MISRVTCYNFKWNDMIKWNDLKVKCCDLGVKGDIRFKKFDLRVKCYDLWSDMFLYCELRVKWRDFRMWWILECDESYISEKRNTVMKPVSHNIYLMFLLLYYNISHAPYIVDGTNSCINITHFPNTSLSFRFFFTRFYGFVSSC